MNRAARRAYARKVQRDPVLRKQVEQARKKWDEDQELQALRIARRKAKGQT